jgi:hypothetical protein
MVFNLKMVFSIILSLVLIFSKEEKIKVPKSSCKFEFILNKNNPEGFGYKYFADDEHVGPNSICMADSFAFISDPLNNSVKKINIFSGKITSHIQLSTKRHLEISRISSIGKFIVVVSNSDTLYLTDFYFSFVKKVKVSKGKKYIFGKDENKISILISESEQRKDLKIEYKLLNVDYNGEITFSKLISIPIKVQKDEYFSNGQKFLISFNGKNSLLSNSFGKFFMYNKYSSIPFYDSENLAFDSNKISTFEIVKRKLIVYTYFY